MSSTACQNVRRRLKEIVSLPDEEAGDANEQRLGKLDHFDQVFASLAARSISPAISSSETKIEESDENITPLLLACDKSSSTALQYLKSQLEAGVIPSSDLVLAWGGPTERSFCGNTPSHHAAASGLCDALDVLHEYQTLLIEGRHGATENCDPCRNFISLVTEGNQHGDTPLMMAAASGRTTMFRHVLSRSLELAMNGADLELDDCVEITRKALKSGLAMKNHEGCNVVNLACGHGHLDTVTFLVQSHEIRTSSGKLVRICENGDETENDAFRIDFGPLVDVSYTDVEFCKGTIENLESGLAFMKQRNQDSRVREFKAQISQVKACLQILESEVERISLLAARDILNADRHTSLEGPDDINGKQKKRKKKNKKKGECKANHIRPPDDEADEGCSGNAEGGIEALGKDERRPQSPPNRWKSVGRQRDGTAHIQPFVTLSDGTVVSRSSRTEYLSSLPPDTPVADESDSTPGPGPDGASGLRRILESTRGEGLDLESAMESLCLAPSMLLLSEHSLALEMSPCQLEQIEAILAHQTKAVGAARRIQERMLSAKPAGE